MFASNPASPEKALVLQRIICKTRAFIYKIVLKNICNMQNEIFGFLPSKAGIGDGLAVNGGVALRAVLKITFDHETFDKVLHVLRMAAAVKDFLCDADLL